MIDHIRIQQHRGLTTHLCGNNAKDNNTNKKFGRQVLDDR
jgi:hypothetical protein